MTSSIEHDRAVAAMSEQLVEIEQRLIPTGLHVFGRAAELKEKADLLRMVASFDRPEHDARALPKLVANALGLDSEVLNESQQICFLDRKSTRLNSSHRCISYAVFCLKKK